MSPAVAAVVKSVYCDDTDDIEPAKLQVVCWCARLFVYFTLYVLACPINWLTV